MLTVAPRVPTRRPGHRHLDLSRARGDPLRRLRPHRPRVTDVFSEGGNGGYICNDESVVLIGESHWADVYDMSGMAAPVHLGAASSPGIWTPSRPRETSPSYASTTTRWTIRRRGDALGRRTRCPSTGDPDHRPGRRRHGRARHGAHRPRRERGRRAIVGGGGQPASLRRPRRGGARLGLRPRAPAWERCTGLRTSTRSRTSSATSGSTSAARGCSTTRTGRRTRTRGAHRRGDSPPTSTRSQRTWRAWTARRHLHDGSAPTLEDAIERVAEGLELALTTNEIAELAAYVRGL